MLQCMHPAAVLAAALVFLLSACSGEAGRTPPNIILVSIDNLGAPHMGCYGYERNTTPFLDGLAREGVLFENLIAQETWTLPSHASLLSSRYVGAHGMWQIRSKMPGENLVLLQEVLKEAGYRTAAFTTCIYLSATYGFERGFDHFSSSRLQAEELNVEILDYLEDLPCGPFFLFLHYYDVHAPFVEDNPYGDNFEGRGHEEAKRIMRKMKSFIGRKVADLTAEETEWAEEFFSIAGMDEMLHDEQVRESVITKSNIRHWAMKAIMEMGEENVGHIKAAYDNGIAYMDKHLSDLFGEMRKFSWYGDTVFAVTSDHGEAFNQHPGVVGHGGLPFNELVHVPLLMTGPALPGNQRVASLAASVDVAPTLLDLADVAAPRGFQGHSLMPLVRGEAAKSRPVFAGSRDAQRMSLQEERWKLILDMRKKATMLFDLQSPEGEMKEISGLNPEIAARLEKELVQGEEVNQSAGAGIARDEVELDDEAKARLRELGYLK